jgi:hypothetical protein
MEMIELSNAENIYDKRVQNVSKVGRNSDEWHRHKHYIRSPNPGRWFIFNKSSKGLQYFSIMVQVNETTAYLVYIAVVSGHP